jgi:hypothetical protein
MYKWEMRTELIRTSQKITQGRRQIKAIEDETLTVQKSELNQIRLQAAAVQALGQDLLQSMALQLDEQITTSQKRLRELKVQTGL